MGNINGILQLSNDKKDLLIKLEDIIDIPNGNNQIDVELYTNGYYNDCSIIRINGIKLSDTPIIDDVQDGRFVAKYEDVSSAIISLSLDNYKIPNDVDYIDFTLKIKTDVNNIPYEFPIYITNNTLEQYKIYDKQALMIASNMESFMLLRTNPKLTGNVKLVVTEDYNLYLDTFKISVNSILNKQEYRHQPVSDSGNFPHDIYRVFKYLPATEMYSIYPDSYDPHISYHKIDDQIRNLYEYGAEYNSDNLYSENMKILAPLYIGKHLPTYFAIWRSDRLITNDNTITNSEVLKELLNKSECIKIFDLRRSTSIGKYLNNYQNEITKYFAGSCALLFIEQDNDKSSVDHRQGQNTWKGIAYDRGILTDRNETTYFATQTLNAEHPLENFDMFLLNGFSRNKLLFPNIINLEFMFNDPEAADFSMHNYFGLYLTENDFLTFNQVIKNGNDINYTLNYYDTSDNIVNLNTTTIDIIENDDFKDRIFFASTNNAVADLKTMDDFNLFAKNEAANKPYENIISIKGKELSFNEDDKAFLTMDFTKQIKYGEHFKFVIPKYEVSEDEYQQVVFEVIASNDIRLVGTDNNINPYIQTNTTVRPIDKLDDNTKIYRITFYALDVEHAEYSAELSEQIQRLANAINKFDNVLKVVSYGNESISIISSVKDVYFQHIMADEFVNTEDISTNLVNVEDIEVLDTLRYYNYNNVQKCEYIHYINDLYKLVHMSFANNGLEETLNRYANIVKFINIDDFKNSFTYEIDKDIYEETKKVLHPLVYTVNGYYPINLFNNNDGDLLFSSNILSTNFSLEGDNWISIISPFDVEKSIIQTPFEALLINEKINICSPMTLNVGLMGINNIKDIDVYTNNEIIELHTTSLSATFKAGEHVKLDNSDPRIRKFVSYSIISGAIDGMPTGSINSFIILSDYILYTNADNGTLIKISLSADEIVFNQDTEIMLTSINSLDIYNYTVKHPELNEDYYYIDFTNKNKSNLLIPLVPLINCQWKSNGTYFDTQSIIDTDYLINNYDIVGNFIECQYTPGMNNQYIVDSLHDIINIDGKDESIYEYILKTGNIKKYLCNNNKVQTAIGYYNPYIQTLEFIFYGIKFIFKLTSNEYANEIKLNEYDNYEIFILNDYNNTDTNEIIISKKEEFILIINHTYKSGYYYGNSNIKMYKDNLMQDVTYDWYKTPFNYNLINTNLYNNKIYVDKSTSYALNDIQNTKAFVEIDIDEYDGNYSNFDEKPNYTYFTINSSFITKDKHDIYDSSNDIYSNIVSGSYEILTGYDSFVSKYGSAKIDFRKKEGFVIKSNEVSTSKLVAIDGSEKINNYIDSFNNNINMYIIEKETNGEIPEPVKINKTYKPLTIQTIKPNRIKFNNGLFNPNFVDIFNFKINDPISEVLNIDTLYGNTLISSIDSIKNYYHNKVLAGSYEKTIGVFNSETNESTNKIVQFVPTYTYNYFMEEYRSPFSTNWDNNIYRQYKTEIEYENLSGYSLGIDDKMFFGSKVINIHNKSILLDKWNYQQNINNASYNISKHNEHSKAKLVLEIELNLTKTFYDYNFNCEEFINNWRNIAKASNTNIYINNYITNVLYNIYNFKSDFDVVVYKQYDEFVSDKPAAEHLVLESGILTEPEIDTNYKTEFKDVNNEVILTITIDDYENYKYYPTVKINKI